VNLVNGEYARNVVGCIDPDLNTHTLLRSEHRECEFSYSWGDIPPAVDLKENLNIAYPATREFGTRTP